MESRGKKAAKVKKLSHSIVFFPKCQSCLRILGCLFFFFFAMLKEQYYNEEKERLPQNTQTRLCGDTEERKARQPQQRPRRRQHLKLGLHRCGSHLLGIQAQYQKQFLYHASEQAKAIALYSERRTHRHAQFAVFSYLFALKKCAALVTRLMNQIGYVRTRL